MPGTFGEVIWPPTHALPEALLPTDIDWLIKYCGIPRHHNENTVEYRVRAFTAIREQRVKIWKIRQKSSGLFWNGNSWATLVGHFAELTAVGLDDDREMVHLLVQEAPKTTASVAPNTLVVGDRVRFGQQVQSEFAGKEATVRSVTGVEIGVEMDGGFSLGALQHGQPWRVHYQQVTYIGKSWTKYAGVFSVGDAVRFRVGGPSSKSFQGLTGVIVGSDTTGSSFKVRMDPWQKQAQYGPTVQRDELEHYSPVASAVAHPWPDHTHSITGRFGPGSPKGERPEDHPYWPQTQHPQTGEDFTSGEILRPKQIVRGGVPIVGENLFEGRFECPSGSCVEGTYIGSPGGTWKWHRTEARQTSAAQAIPTAATRQRQ